MAPTTIRSWRCTMGNFLALSQRAAGCPRRKAGRAGWPGPEPMGRVGRRAVYQARRTPAIRSSRRRSRRFGVIRWVPLFYGALACLGCSSATRRWLGRFGGLAAVGLYCSSGAALAFAWRDYMPTFTDASLIAAGSGCCCGAAGNRGQSAAAHLGRPRRVRSDRDRNLRPLHQHRDASGCAVVA